MVGFHLAFGLLTLRAILLSIEALLKNLQHNVNRRKAVMSGIFQRLNISPSARISSVWPYREKYLTNYSQKLSDVQYI